jgi:phage-related protein
MLEELKVIIKAETDKFKSNVEEAEKQTKSFKEQVAEAGKSVEDNLAGAGEKISSGLKVGITALAAAGAGLLALGASSAEYRNEQAKLQTAFESAGKSAETAKTTYNDLFRVLGDSGTATEAASHLAQLAVGQEELAEYTNICQGVYATFGDSLPIEGLTEAVNHTVNLGEVQGTLADALEWAGVSTDAFNEKLAACNTEAEREKLIRETLNGLYGEAAANFEVNNAAILAQNEAQSKMNDAMAALGEVTAPIMTMLTELGANVLSAITPYLQSFAENYLPVIKDVLAELSEKLAEVFDWMGQNKEVLAAIAIVIGTVVAAIGLYNTVAAVKAAMDAAQVTTIWGLVAAHTAQAAAAMAAMAPYILVVAAIAAVIAIIVLCIKHWDDICAAVGKAWEFIKGVWEVVANWINENVVQPIVEFFTGLWNKITEIFGSVKEWFSNIFSGAWDAIKTAFASVGSFFSGIWDGIKNAFSNVTGWFKDIFSKAWQGVKDVFSTGGKIFDGIKDGIANVFKTVVNGIIGGINKVIKVPFDAINKMLRKLKGIDILGVKPFGWIKEFNVPQIPKLAEGGVVDSATLAMIGERGKEAVMPLENNLEWLDKLAGMLNARMGSGMAPIVLQVDGKTFAEISVSSINQLTRQRGSLPLVMA